MVFFYWLMSAQIVLESFPISSSTHIKLLELFLSRYDHLYNHQVAVSPLLHAYDPDIVMHIAHAPTLLIITLFFYDRWSFLLVHIRRCWKIILKIIGLTCLADTITVFFYLGIKQITIPEIMTGIGLCITAGLLFSLRFVPSLPFATWNISRALILGTVQGFALLPGISRLASTYVTARWLQLAPRKAFEIALLIQCPLIMVALLHGIYTVGVSTIVASLYGALGIIFFIATVLAWCSLRLVYYLAMTERLWWLSFYMIIPIVGWILLVYG